MNDEPVRFELRLPSTLREKLAAAAAADGGRSVASKARSLIEHGLDPAAPLSNADRATFGHNAKRHPVLGFLIEDGVGSLPVEQQAAAFVMDVERSHGKAAADVLRRELEAATQKEKP
jgi:hypothetical protein